MKLGIDIGSTTIKLALISEANELLYNSYQRHNSKINEHLLSCLNDIKEKFPAMPELAVAITGSAGMGLAEGLDIGFVQEVFATKIATNILRPNTDVVIELGGEDAKILFLANGLEVRMNGTCAGGTGAFIDQIATLLAITPEDMNELAKSAKKSYSIASRCGVFAKSDVQPLLNQGATKEDLSASIFQSVVNQTITGLAQGRDIKGKILYLGGPLTFISELRKSFDNTLKLKGICPPNSLYYVAIGCAICADTFTIVDNLIYKVASHKFKQTFEKIEPLFQTEKEYRLFLKRHNKTNVTINQSDNYQGNAHIGIDAGSTTIKVVAINENEEIIFSKYQTNNGNPNTHIKEILEELYSINPKINVCSASVTGYGEEMIKNAFNLDFGLVETVAHYTAAKKFNSNVDFIIDIGGQDMKCFKVVDGVIDDIFLNEACSSGCGSFLQTFANILGYSSDEYGKIGLFAKSPVDLGSRCTVFMNSSVKQAQKDGASVEDISAGLSSSVVKNVIYKLIRTNSASELGKNIVVQGGTFLNDAILRSFEKEIGGKVIRPNIAGIMGAYGAALYGKHKITQKSTMLDLKSLTNFTHKINYTNCKLCTNQCALTINTFNGGRKFIAGNRCDKPTISNKKHKDKLNLYEYKRNLLEKYMNIKLPEPRGKIGIPLVLNMYELLPFWVKFFNELGFEVVTSGFSDSTTYSKGQNTIPSDTVCFPAKLVHGHIEELLTKDIDAIFYPCMTYNINENRGDNNYNCPVVAYYPETVVNNIGNIKNVRYIYDYIGIHLPKYFVGKIKNILGRHFDKLSKKDIQHATNCAFRERDIFLAKVRKRGEKIILKARENNQKIIVLAGRPYHLDPKVNHSIDKLISSYNVPIITEDSICHLVEEKSKVNVLNQWTYHARLYDAAKYISTQHDMHLVQLVSFGCGVDAITTDEVKSILQDGDKIYTQLKIDEITNLGATKIRIRSLLAVIEQKEVYYGPDRVH
ncbi:2-hydroxyglutaryl-CoA dehydratase [Candidatus Epulonipiscium fishelsonii]|uniref:2-hydroxyglutaryl-CoA dehydratase n=1 Tax=Candidatus Epulonipiscium fishelsonii TaxID=77094 RepID=A0ACC8X8S2_9FIRM|nr:2-hydroxyglutaryl-CoA dehydratase [Epulopiscium sp. SCG-B11WGA-EpuloA1]ONI43616.1 2-hydroxyglutaryl-CoA dehydratase [Epulopiscium sp. SCG-B05WGA-EpuloA1]